MAGDPVWKRRVLEAPRVERVADAGRERRHPQDPGHRPRRRPVGRRGRLPQAPARRVQGARHRDRRGRCGDVAVAATAATAGPGRRRPRRGRPRRGNASTGIGPARPSGRHGPRARYDGRPADIDSEGLRERRAAPSVARDREPAGRDRGSSRRTRPSPPRPTRRPTCTPRPRRTSRRSGRSARASGSTGRSRSTTTLEWDLPFAKWFTGGELNVAYNCVDRHVERGLGDKVAYHWIGEPGDTRTLTFRDLQREVSKAANALKELGVETGDRVAIYMPMIPELPIAMLACARIGAPHTVVFGGFSAEALSGRINDCGAKVLITADGGYRRGKEVGAQAPRRRGARRSTPTIEAAIVVKRLGHDVHMVPGPRPSGGTTSSTASPRTARRSPVDSEHMLYLLYTSGTTAKPKGILHTTAGYLLGTSFTHEAIFDIKPDDVYWCAADIGWVTGHSYIVYGPLANATTGVMYEGAPDTPAWDRWWQIVEDYKVTILYCAPTAIRAFMKQGEAWPAKHDLSSLRVLGSVGEPINPEAWLWYREHIGGDKAPVVDTWWQTETGQILITPLPGVTDHEAGLGDLPVPGHRRRRRRRRRQLGAARWRRLSRPQAPVAGDAARHLRRPGALQARPTGAASRGCTSPATAPSATRTATSGCSAGSTTS